MEKFTTPIEIDDSTKAFPGDVKELIPDYSEIPDEFKILNSVNKWVKWTDNWFSVNKWVKWTCDWFYEGLSSTPKPKDGIDIDLAINHLATILHSFQPKHEHKIAAVAFLASLWFETTGN